jgi:adenylate cyclase
VKIEGERGLEMGLKHVTGSIDSFRIGDRLVTPALNEIDGVRVESKAMEVLMVLAEAAPNVASNATLLQRIWPDVIVVDNVLYQAVAQLRKALGDDAHAPRYIETVPRRGYHMIAQVTRELFNTRASSVVPARKNSICVLPFSNMSGDAEQEYFSDGISEDIITDLSKVSTLLVIARNTAFTFKAKSVDLSQVARQLNVSHVLEGSVRRTGGRVRISAQLIDGATGGHVWAERYDRDLNNIFALQDEISAAIVDALKLKLLPGEKQRMERRGTSNVEAYDLYLRGTRPAFAPDEMRDRIALLEAATRLAPDYPDAWGALADLRVRWMYYRPFDERDDIQKTVATEAARALALDPNNVGALIALTRQRRDLAGWEAGTSRIVEIAPRNVDALCERARFRGYVGRFREAIDLAQRAYEVDPMSPVAATARADMLCAGGRYAEARLAFDDILSQWPDNHRAAGQLLLICVHMHDWATVDALLAPDRLARYPLRENTRIPWYVSVMRDPAPEVRRQPIEEARRRFAASSNGSDYLFLQVAAELGDADEAHTIALESPIRSRRNWIGISSPIFLLHPLFAAFRRDPRFVKHCARFGFVEHWMTTRTWPDFVDEVAPYYDLKAECAKVAAEPPSWPANETASSAPAV